MDKLDTLVRPGTGVQVVKQPLAPIRTQLTKGVYTFDAEARTRVREALADSTVEKPEIKGILDYPANKGFRNGYASIAIEKVWKPYTSFVTGQNRGVFRVEFDGTKSSLVRISPEALAAMSSRQIAEALANSNQAVPTHLVCEEFSDGRVPVISGDAARDAEYFDGFIEQTDLVVRGGDFFKSIPNACDSPSKFIASGLVVLRTHVFGLPNLIDDVAAREGLTLTPDQHRTAVDTSLRASIAHYYLPTGPLNIAINNQLVDSRTGELKPASWTSNGNPNKYVVFPQPDIVREVNQAAAERALPVQTNCPAFHSQVTTTDEPDRIVPLPRSLAAVALEQLDTWYYPRRRQE